MCCFTHEQVNQADILDHGLKYVIALLARDVRLRCQCKNGDKCKRQVTQEDMLCDYCRGCGHSTDCQDLHGLPPGIDRHKLIDQTPPQDPTSGTYWQEEYVQFENDPRYRVN